MKWIIGVVAFGLGSGRRGNHWNLHFQLPMWPRGL